LCVIVVVEGPAELLGWVAHSIRAIVSSGAVGGNTIALSSIRKTAENAKQFADVVIVDFV
jgi:hypothetical protein